MILYCGPLLCSIILCPKNRLLYAFRHEAVSQNARSSQLVRLTGGFLGARKGHRLVDQSLGTFSTYLVRFGVLFQLVSVALLPATMYGVQAWNDNFPGRESGEDAALEHTATEGRIQVRPEPGMEEAVPRFLQNRQTDVRVMTAALQRDDFEQIRTLGHNMKGAGEGYGFPGITVIGQLIEEVARARDAGKVRVQIAALSRYLSRVEVIED